MSNNSIGLVEETIKFLYDDRDRCYNDTINNELVHGIMMTSSNGNIIRVTGPFCGEFPAQRPVTRSFDVFFDLRPNKRLSKQSWG